VRMNWEIKVLQTWPGSDNDIRPVFYRLGRKSRN
jgi:hypothetical protein